MRIVCQKCSAAYAIDDKFVTPKGVRAQCPRCRHLQLVKKDDAAPPPPEAAPPAAPAPTGGPSPFLFDMGAAPPPASSGSGLHFGQTAPAPGGAPAPSNPFDFSAPTSPSAPAPFDFGAPPAPPAAAPAPFDFAAVAPPPPAGSPFDFGAPPGIPGKSTPGVPSPFAAMPPPPPPPSFPGGPARAPAPPPPAESPFDFGAPPPASESPFGAALDFTAPPPPPAPPARLAAPAPAPAAPAAQVVGVKCRSCGKEMTDPFDQALGVCDDCRNKTAEVSASSAAAESPFPAVTDAPRPAPLFPPAGTPITAGDASQVRSATRAGAGESGGGRGKAVGLVVGLLAVIAVGAFLAIKRPWVSKPPPLVVRPGSGGGPAAPVESIIQQWKLKYPDIEQTADQLIDEGEALLTKDTTRSYLDAEESFEQALVLKPTNERALAGWVLALAFGKPGKIDDPTAKSAESMLAAAEQRSGDLRVYVAHAHFLIARNGNPNDIRVLAERGLNSTNANDKALASLAIGQTVLAKNPQQAAQAFREALATDPKLKRAYFFQAQLAAIEGNYREATRALERRLELDADQWEAAEELARLLLDVGETTRARKVLEAAKAAAPRSARARIGLAVLSYQHQGDLSGAAAELSAVVDDPEYGKPEKADALVHLAAIQRMKGELDAASASVDRSLEYSAESVPAKLQKFLVLLEKGVNSSARLELDGLKGKLGDKYLEATLEGRMLIAENRLDEAIQTLSSTAESDPRRVDAIFLAGAAAAKAKKAGKAWEFCLRRGLRADPWSRPVPSLTLTFVRPADLLRPAVGTYASLVANLDEDPSPSLCEGLVAWHSEEFAAAEKHFVKVTTVDPKNAEAYSYRSLLASRKRDFAGALKLAARALDANKQSGLGWFAQAVAQAGQNKMDLAKVSAQQAQKQSPQLLGPRVLISDGEASQKNGDEARRILTSVLLADPLYREAKRVLYKHQL
ncbi:MAG: tetratricopeptide repeat protein [Myxococcota bacterium]